MIIGEEDQNIEFKESWNSTELLKWVCGFANADGGCMYIGVRDDGKVIGLPNSRKLMEDIPNAIVNAFGMYDVKVNLLKEKDKKYIEIVVPKSNVVLDYKGISYIKIGTTLQVMKGQAFRESVLERGSMSWDAYPVDGVSIDDLDDGSFKIFKDEAIKAGKLSGVNLDDKGTILNELKLLVGDKLTQAAVLLFHPKPYRIIPCAYVQIGRFRDDATILYQDILQGSLMMLCDSVVNLIYTKYYYNLISYDRTTRHETPPYPDRAIREAIYNSLMHSDWSAGQPVTIKVYDFKIVINNRSILPNGWTMEDHSSLHINPLISNTFMYAGFVERFGSGIPKMINACNEVGCPKPEYIIYDKSISLTLRPSEKYMALAHAFYNNNVGENVGETGLQGGTCKRRQAILALIKKNPSISAAEIALVLDVSTRTIERDFDWLREHGIVDRSGGARGSFIYSRYADYSSIAVGIDLGLNYYNPNSDFSFSVTARNLGAQLKAFGDRRDKLPANVQVGFSKRMAHAPFRISVTLNDLTRWSDTAMSTRKFGKKLLNHVVIGMDLLLSQNFYIAAGYNLRRSDQMQVNGSSHWAGFTAGAGLQIKRFKLGAAYGKYHVSSSSFVFNLAYSL